MVPDRRPAYMINLPAFDFRRSPPRIRDVIGLTQSSYTAGNEWRSMKSQKAALITESSRESKRKYADEKANPSSESHFHGYEPRISNGSRVHLECLSKASLSLQLDLLGEDALTLVRV